VPGQTSHERAKSLFESRGIPLTVDNGTNGLLQVGHKANGDFAYWLNITLSISATRVTRIDTAASVNGRQTASAFTDDFRPYQWGRLMTRLGKPSSVQLSVICPSERGAPFEYLLELEFGRAGVGATYIGPVDGAVARGDSLLVCPRFGQVNTVELILSPAGSGGKIDEAAHHVRSVDINPEQFFNEFRTTEGTSCMKWPTAMN
jgi:hypothetical protein